MSLSLYHVANDLSALLDSGIDEDGVISPELESTLAKFEGKGASVAAYILNCDAAIGMLDDHIQRIQKRKKAIENRTEWLRKYLQDNMAKTGITEITADDKTFSVKLFRDRDSSVEVMDESKIPDLYKREVPASFAVDKKLIAQALKDGHDVPGAVLRKKDRLTIK